MVRMAGQFGEDIDYPDPEQQMKRTQKAFIESWKTRLSRYITVSVSSDGLPGDWLMMCKDAIRTIVPHFTMRRMLKEYLDRLYLPAMQPIENSKKH